MICSFFIDVSFHRPHIYSNPSKSIGMSYNSCRGISTKKKKPQFQSSSLDYINLSVIYPIIKEMIHGLTMEIRLQCTGHKNKLKHEIIISKS